MMHACECVVPMAAIGKPRMTQRDRWKKRPCVIKYREWCDELRRNVSNVPEDASELHWVAYFPFPKSYNRAKRARLAGGIHQEKPDKDNIDKAIMDALFPEDKKIAVGSQQKRWDDGDGPRIHIRIK